jgi:putative transposase
LDRSVEEKRRLIEPDHSQLSLSRQCHLLGLARRSFYYQPRGESDENLHLMRLLDEQYTRTPFYGVRKMTAWLRDEGYPVNDKRIRRLLRLMGLEAIYQRPKLSESAPGHRIYPYLLRGVPVLKRESRLVDRHHLYSLAARLHLAGGDHRLVLTLCGELGNLDHAR